MKQISSPKTGYLNLITDVEGLLVGQAEDPIAKTGVTVLTCPSLWTAAVDIRGGGPGGRESAVLDPENLVGGVHAIVLTGGSVFGLAAADAVTVALSNAGKGLDLNSNHNPVPIIPAAVLYDLANGGKKDWGERPPYYQLGKSALQQTSSSFSLGKAGAGYGAMAGTVRGGLGSASLDLGDGLVVGALVAANPVGSPYMADNQSFWAWPFEIEQEFGGHRPDIRLMHYNDPFPDTSRIFNTSRLKGGANTMLAVVATTAELDRNQTKRLAIMAQDGFARAVRPVHTPFDGDTLFALSSGAVSIGQGNDANIQLARIGSAAADCVTRAIARAVYCANK
ncbi:MAG: P1 family peptidase [Zymomonas mobilis]|uniref:L-aminopeptidase/D-esterase-like protein n=1 Tax=Zymomonas mobilis TaxID=542 RepID=A0A542W194_ZYMMB|nr:P1 family peptidase [Zymomonas mobilis]TQL17344.1 L-aminopeptidase/D-esterase-like protein [Zymomonas mobilis]